MTDDDKDEVRCRWANSNAGECGQICGGYGLPNAYMFYVRLFSHFYQLRENVAFCVALSYTCVSPFFVIFCTVFPMTHSLFLLIARMQNHLQCNGIHRLLRCCCHDRRFCLANRHTAIEWHSVAVFGVRVQLKRSVWWTPGVHGIHAGRGIVYWNPSWRNILRSYHRASRWTIKKVKGNKK